jgi:hypothetical protein
LFSPSSPNFSPAFATSWNGSFLGKTAISSHSNFNLVWYELGLYALPDPDRLQEDLIQWLAEQEDLVPACMELLDEDTLGELLGRLAHIGEVKDLSCGK